MRLPLSRALLVGSSILLLAVGTPSSSRAQTPTAAAVCSANDLKVWKATEFAIVEENLDYCGKKTLGADSVEARKCLADLTSGLSTSCLECQVKLISCTASKCASSCISGGKSNPVCANCVDSNCNPAFATCTGFEFPDCSDCVKTRAPVSSGGFIPSQSMGASVAIVVVPIVAVLLGIVLYRRGCFSDDDTTFVPSHPLANAGSNPNMLASPGSFRQMDGGQQQGYLTGPPQGMASQKSQGQMYQAPQQYATGGPPAQYGQAPPQQYGGAPSSPPQYGYASAQVTQASTAFAMPYSPPIDSRRAGGSPQFAPQGSQGLYPAAYMGESDEQAKARIMHDI